MKKTLSFIFALASTVAVEAQTADPVIMTINGKAVPRSEFVYSYKKNNGADVIDHKTVREYVELFANYKRKVEAALDAHLDTLTSYKTEFRQYRDQQVMPTLINDADVEVEAHKIYDAENERIGVDGINDVSHIYMRVRQDDDDAVVQRQKERIDSIYRALKAGGDFETLAKQCSEDKATAQRGGRMGQLVKGTFFEKFENAVLAMKPGEISAPVQTEVGFHIIKLNDRYSLPPYDSLRNNIMQYVERSNLRKDLAKKRLEEIAVERGMTNEAVADMRADSLAAVSEEMKYLIQEYHDGLLLYEISNREVWEKAANDEKGLEAFWKKNKKKYTWEEPRFKGIAYYTREASDVDAVKKCLKGKKFSEWTELLRNTFNKDSVLRIRAEKGVFKKGMNGIVDREIYGDATAKIKERKDYPNTAVYGKLLKAPEEMSDVRALVVADYQEAMEAEWLKTLKARYVVKVNEDVLSTIKEE